MIKRVLCFGNPARLIRIIKTIKIKNADEKIACVFSVLIFNICR